MQCSIIVCVEDILILDTFTECAKNKHLHNLLHLLFVCLTIDLSLAAVPKTQEYDA